jgi:hypothetical protein
MWSSRARITLFELGGHDSGYRTVLNSLCTDGLGDKVIMLDNGDNARAIAELDLNVISIPGLFVDKSTEAGLVVRPNEVDPPLPSPSTTSSPVLISARPTSPIKGDTKDQNTYSAKAAGILTSALNVAPRPIGYSKLNKPKESDDGPKVDRTKVGDPTHVVVPSPSLGFLIYPSSPAGNDISYAIPPR